MSNAVRPVWSLVEEGYARVLVGRKLRYREIAEAMTARFGRPFSKESVRAKLVRRPSESNEADAYDVDLSDLESDAAPPTQQSVRDPSDPPETESAPPEAQRAPRVAVEDERSETIAKLVDLTKRKPLPLEAICDALDMPPGKVRGLVDEAKSRGLRVELDGAHVGRRPSVPSDEHHDVTGVAAAGDQRIVALVGDIHIGNRHHMGAQLADFCRIAYARGVRTFCHAGDLLDGVYKHSVWEQSHRGFEEQASEAARTLPQMPGASWHFIAGNHDETLGEANGLAVGQATVAVFRARGREDLHFHGDRGAYLRLKAATDPRGLLVHLWHPRDKGNAYARSYVHQKKIEGFPVGGKPDVLACGHHHTQSYITTRGVHAFGLGCWQGSGSSFAKSLRGAPDIGSWIIEYSLTDGGTVRTLRAEWVSYYEHESVRDVGLS